MISLLFSYRKILGNTVMDIISGTTLGILQGLTEFLPVSSTGHLILARGWLGISSEHGLAIDAVLQLATALAVLIYFFKDFLNLGYTALYRLTGRPVRKEDERLLLALVAGTVPAVVLGLLLENAMETVFRNAMLVAWTLIAGSLVMLAAEYALRHNEGRRTSLMGEVGAGKGFLIGLFQSLALIPGMSRSGMTISGGLFLGLSREAAARFGFMLSLPIILGSGLKKLLELSADGTLVSIAAPLAVASGAAFLSGLLAIYILLRYVRTHSLGVFIAYRLVLVAIILFFL